MGLFKFGKTNEGGFSDVIRCDEHNYLVWKWRPSGAANSTVKENSIRYGSILTVNEGEVAVFRYKQKNGILMDYIEGPYQDTIKTYNFPILADIMGAAFGGTSPFPAEVYFINLAGNNQIDFAIPYFDICDGIDMSLTLPVTVHGTIMFNITDYRKFVSKHRLINFELDDLRKKIKSILIQNTADFLTNYPIENRQQVINIGSARGKVAASLNTALAPILDEHFGVNLITFGISKIEIDKESDSYKTYLVHTQDISLKLKNIETEDIAGRKKLSRETEYLQTHMVNKQAEILQTAASSLGQMGSVGDGGGMNAAGLMMGLAMGQSMGGQVAGMMNNMQNAAQPQAGMPPMPGVQQPAAVESPIYHISVNGAQYGPYTLTQMQQMAQSGQITGISYVWKPGMPNWETAMNIPELRMLFATNTPPPPPPPAM